MRRTGASRLGKVSLRDQIVEVLREDILAHKLNPGSTLVEKVLAERFKVSKTPVREALTMLAHEGLVEVFPHKGYLVSGVTIKDVHDYFDLRMILECAAVEMAASKLTDEQLSHLESLVTPENSVEKFPTKLDRNSAFHSVIAHASGNERLARLIEGFLQEMRRLISVGWVPGEHFRLMAALRERSPQRAKEAMREHILTVRDNALRGATHL
jgi:DNA-binding GntR family transcriptional regulator